MERSLAFSRHVCHIYREEGERRGTLLAFIREGLERGEGVICIAQPRPAERWLGRELGGAQEGTLRFHAAGEVFDPAGRPDARGAVSWILREVRERLREGVSGVRIALDMGWAAGDTAAEGALLRYELELERRLRGRPAICLCQYPLKGFSPSTLLGMVGVHPVICFRGRLVDNRRKEVRVGGGDPWAAVLGKFLAHALKGEEAGELMGDLHCVASSRAQVPFPGLSDAPVLTASPSAKPAEGTPQSWADFLGDAVVGWDEGERICLWNRVAEALSGWRAEEILGKKVSEVLLPADDQGRGDPAGGNAAYPGAAREGIMITREGGRLEVEFTLGSWQGGDTRKYFAVLREVREKKLMERALRESEERYRELFENMGEGVAVVDEEENILFANPAGHRIFGVQKGDLVGRNLREFTDDENFALLQEQTMIRKAGRKSVYELQIRDAAGRRKVLRVTATPRFDRQGNYKGAFGVFADVTERKFREEELEGFASTVAHDLSSSLAIVEGFSLAALRAAEEGDAELENESLQHVREAVGRMQRFVDYLLEYAKSGRPGGRAERVKVEEMAWEVGKELGPLLQKKGIRFRVASPTREAQVDPVRLRQVLYNLVNNAAAHMGDVREPEIVVGSRERKGTLVVFVRDNGVGIPPEIQEGIFEPFSKGEGGGSGLGLAIVKRAVESWGGRVWVDSSPGKGTAFFFTVPPAPADREG